MKRDIRELLPWIPSLLFVSIIVVTLFQLFIGVAGAQGSPSIPPMDMPTEDLWVLVVPILLSVALTCLRLLPPDFPDFGKRAIVALCSLILAAIGLAVAGRLTF